jgi:DNA polymerase-4
MSAERRILHVDMDAFFAAVEQRDRPELRGRPVIVGGPPDSRGVVCTASYEARRFGVHSAMPCSQAHRLCPDGIFVPPDFRRYAAASDRIHEIFLRHTDLVEPLSLDEAYLDVTQQKGGLPTATAVAQEIRRQIREELGLTASAGVSTTKAVAKIASDMRKPDGLTVVPPWKVAGFLAPLPVRRLPGVGPVTEAACRRLGILRCSDLLRHDEETLVQWFGRFGHELFRLARGIDDRPVITDWVRKSCGIEDTFPRDLLTRAEAEAALATLARNLSRRLEEEDLRGATVTLKVKYSDFTQITRARRLPAPTRRMDLLLRTASGLLGSTEVGQRPVRLLGIALGQLDTRGQGRQLHFPFMEDILAAGSGTPVARADPDDE